MQQQVQMQQQRITQQQIAAQASAMLLKKQLEFSPEQLAELRRAGRFGKTSVPSEYAIIPD
jgi:hypothetical protein